MKAGAEQFLDWLERRGFSQRDAASHFGWNETFISQLVTRKRTPGLTNAVKIERETGIPVEAWMASELDESVPVLVVDGRKRKALQDVNSDTDR